MTARVNQKGGADGKEMVRWQLGSDALLAASGQSIASAMVERGVLTCRTTAKGELRGIFCGMGVCQDCVVDVVGEGRRCACMTKVGDGKVVRPSSPQSETCLPQATPETIQTAPDVVVIGGGPAGLSAASVIAESGIDVLLVDERLELGGQFYKQPAEGLAVGGAALDTQFRRGRALIRRFLRSGARHLSGTTVWGAFGPRQIVASNARNTVVIESKIIILATGAYERGIPMPGWTLPGFMTTGAAQTLLRSYRVKPGDRVLVGGNGPLNFQVAIELVRAGVEVVALAELALRPGIASWRDAARMMASLPGLFWDGLRYHTALKRAGVPILYRHSLIGAEGRGRVERATVAAIDDEGRPIPGTERVHAVDVVCTGYGFLPSNEIARTLGCRHRYDDRRRVLVPERSDTGRASVPNVWIIGDSAGLGGARAAEAGGIIAGADVAAVFRKRTGSAAREAAAAIRRRRKAMRFQSALWALFRAPAILDQLAKPETLVCRCEDVPLATLNDAITEGMSSPAALKRLTRAGMGPCQGRYCGPFIVDLVARAKNVTVDELSFFAPRVPFKPQPLDVLAGFDT